MDNNFDVPLDEAAQNQSSNGIHVSNDIRINLREFSMWNLVLAILGAISLGQNLIVYVFKKDLQTSLISLLLTLLFSALIIWLYYRMHETSKALSVSHSSYDMDALAIAIKNFYMTLGIVLIIALVIVVAMIFFIFMVGVGNLN